MTDSSSESNGVDALVQEYLERKRQGENPSVAEYCKKYPDLAAEFRSLLPTLEMMEDFLPGWEEEAVEAERRIPALERIGGYRIVAEIGRGGMGVVYEAEQESLGRRVALKVLPRRVSPDGSSARRFQNEARAAARMHHTNIVPVFEVGEDGDHLFYAMQLIRGQSLDRVIEDLRELRGFDRKRKRRPGESDMSISRSLLHGMAGAEPTASLARKTDETSQRPPKSELLPDDSSSSVLSGQAFSGTDSGHGKFFVAVARVGLQAAEAISYSHTHGIIHRDIKPSNLILDALGVIWITDFGLAKADEDEDLTHTGDIVGTVRYMAPERFSGKCDVRADVYALGLTLYELLVLKPAFHASSRAALISMILHEDPPRPRTIDARIPRDLETIVLHATDKDHERRYGTAESLADDLRRFLRGEPIQARRVSTLERFWRWSRRNRGLAASLTVAATLLILLTVGAIIAAERLSGLGLDYRLEAERSNTAQLKAEERSIELRRSLYAAQMNEAGFAAFEPGGSQRILAILEEWRPGLSTILPGGQEEDLRGWEWYYLLGRVTTTPHPLPEARPETRLRVFHWSPDGRRVVAAGTSGALRIWDFESGEDVLRLEGHERGVADVRYSPDGLRIASASSDQTVRIWDANTGGLLRTISFPDHVTSVAWSPGGDRLAATCKDGTLRLWNTVASKTATWETVRDVRHGQYLLCIRFDSTSRFLAGAAQDASIWIWDARTLQETARLEGHTRAVADVAWHPSEEAILASASGDGTARVWDVAGKRELLVLSSHLALVKTVDWSPDGTRLATGSHDCSVRVWSYPDGVELRRLDAHSRGLNVVGWRPGGRHILSLCGGKEFVFWSRDGLGEDRVLSASRKSLTPLRWNHDGTRLAAGSRTGADAGVWSFPQGEFLYGIAGDDDEVRGISWSPTTAYWPRAARGACYAFGAPPATSSRRWIPRTRRHS